MRLQHVSHAVLTPATRGRRLFLGAALALGLTTTSGLITPSQAANVKLGDWDVQIDVTGSVGMSWLQKSVNKQYLPLANGGPADGSVYGGVNAATLAVDIPTGNPATDTQGAANVPGILANMDQCDMTYGGYCQEILAVPNFDGSINTDDGRLNFDKGDPFSGLIRITPEFEAFNGPWTVFARLNVWHDVVAMDEDAYNRGGELTDDGEENAGQNLELLDAYVSFDGDVGDMPFTVRAGRQVINWGEATFIPGGNSAFNPIDVAALRRPGAEIKEALLPVEALYGSIAVTQDITVEAYVGGWDKYRLEAGGTPNSISDSFTDGTTSGNPQDVYYIGGGFRSGDQFACDGAAPLGALGAGADGMIDPADSDASVNSDNKAYYLASVGIINAIKAIDGAVGCAESPNLDAVKKWTEGSAEAERAAAGDTNIVRGLEDEDGDEAFGLAVRWYAENLNSTEFAFYYQKGDSRLPYIDYWTDKPATKAYSTPAQSSTVGRGAGPLGCLGLAANSDIASAAIPALNIPAGAKLYNPALATISVNDTKGLLSSRVNAAPTSLQGIANGVAATLNVALGGYSRSAPIGDNAAYLQETNCLLTIAQRNNTIGSPLTTLDDQGQLHTGASNIGTAANIDLQAVFPEVETYGLSFNTTVAGWGVQGDFTFRPDVPLQYDTDALTIAALFNNCLFNTVGVLEAVYLSGSTYANEHGTIGCNGERQRLIGYTTDYDGLTWDIGTTATFTRSNPIVNFLGSDLGIFLTEFQGVVVDGIEEERGNTGGITALGQQRGITPLTNVCQGGSDLPLNGILSIDDRSAGDVRSPDDNNPKGFCRPTDSSWGVVLMAQLQYNNAFGTPVALKPQIIYSSGMEGYSPSPLGFWRDGVGSTAFSLTADYLGTWSANLSYRTYHGDVHRTRNLDRDVLSASVSYAF